MRGAVPGEAGNVIARSRESPIQHEEGVIRNGAAPNTLAGARPAQSTAGCPRTTCVSFVRSSILLRDVIRASASVNCGCMNARRARKVLVRIMSQGRWFSTMRRLAFGAIQKVPIHVLRGVTFTKARGRYNDPHCPSSSGDSMHTPPRTLSYRLPKKSAPRSAPPANSQHGLKN
jgi:hypothetical protein